MSAEIQEQIARIRECLVYTNGSESWLATAPPPTEDEWSVTTADEEYPATEPRELYRTLGDAIDTLHELWVADRTEDDYLDVLAVQELIADLLVDEVDSAGNPLDEDEEPTPYQLAAKRWNIGPSAT
jgi:hypothetical protein